MVFPEPRKPVTMVTGMGAIVVEERRGVSTFVQCTEYGLRFCDEKRRGSPGSR